MVRMQVTNPIGAVEGHVSVMGAISSAKYTINQANNYQLKTIISIFLS